MQMEKGFGFLTKETERSYTVTYAKPDWRTGAWEEYSSEYSKSSSHWIGPIRESVLIATNCIDNLVIVLRDISVELIAEDEYAERIRPLLEAARLNAIEAAKQAACELREHVYASEADEIAKISVVISAHPTFVQALERGCVLCPKIPGIAGKVLQQESDGSYSASFLGALYVGCVGLEGIDPSLLDADASTKNASCMKMLEIVKNTIRYWRKASGQYRSVGTGILLQNPNGSMGRASKNGFLSFEKELFSEIEGDTCERTKGLRLIMRDKLARMDKDLIRQKDDDHKRYLYALEH